MAILSFGTVLLSAPTALVLVVSTLLLFLYWGSRKSPRLPPGPPRVPVLGNIHQIGHEPHKSFMEMGERYGDIFSIYLGSYPAVVINDPQLLKDALAENAFSGRQNFLKIFKDRGGGAPRGLIFSDGPLWTEQRRFALKTLRDFGFGKQSMESIIQHEAQELVDSLKLSCGRPIDTQFKFQAAILNSLWGILTGTRFQHDDPEYIEIVRGLTANMANARVISYFNYFPALYNLRKYVPWLFGQKAVARANNFSKAIEFIQKIVKERQESYNPNEEPSDYIDTYLHEIKKSEPGSSFHGKEGVANMTLSVFDLFIAGGETTATTLRWMFLLLALHPEVQEKFHKEIKQVVGVDRPPCLADRDNLPYTDAVIKEVMRVSSLAPTAIFHAITHSVEFGGYFLPKETIVIPNLYASMRSKKVWGVDADVFKPERFLDAKKVPDAFIPFSTGRRVCLGESLAKAEAFIFATALIQRFKITPDPNGPKLTGEPICGSILLPKPHEIVLHDRLK